MNRSRFATFLLVLSAAAAIAVPTTATATVNTVASSLAGTAEYAPGAKPRASVKLATCTGSPLIDARRVVVNARMWLFTDTPEAGQKRQMRFDVFRKFNEQTRFKRVKDSKLGIWTTEDESATIDQRSLAINGLDTAAKYFVRVSFRWYGTDGTTIEFKRRIDSKVCTLKDRLPDPVAVSATKAPVPGTNAANYSLKIKNRGGSEIDNLPFAFLVDGVPAATGTVDTLLKGDTVLQSVQAPWCAANISVQFDSGKTQRIAVRGRQVFTLPC